MANKFIEERSISDGFPKNLLIENDSGRAEVLLKGSGFAAYGFRSWFSESRIEAKCWIRFNLRFRL